MYIRHLKSRGDGFTLLEILVVLAVIGILATILVANFSDARKNSKNKLIRTTLSEVQLALEVYKAQNSQYPASIGALVPSYIQRIPEAGDFANGSCSFNYVTGGSNSYYKLTAQNCFAGATSQANGVSQNDEFARCPTTCGGAGVCNPASLNFYESMAVYSIGGECL